MTMLPEYANDPLAYADAEQLPTEPVPTPDELRQLFQMQDRYGLGAQMEPVPGPIGSSFGDRLALALRDAPAYQGRGFAGHLLSGVARGYAGVKLPQLQERAAERKAAQEANRAALAATAKARSEALQQAAKNQAGVAQARYKALGQAKRDQTYGAVSDDDAEAIAGAMDAGLQPPVTTGLYRNAAKVKASLARRGFDQTQAMLQWTSALRWAGTINNSQFSNLRSSVYLASQTLDNIEQLSKQLESLMPRTGISWANKPLIEIARNATAFGPEAANVAAQLVAQVETVHNELPMILSGGYAPHDMQYRNADKMINAASPLPTLAGQLKATRRDINYRLNGLNSLGAIGPGNPAQPFGGFSVGRHAFSSPGRPVGEGQRPGPPSQPGKTHIRNKKTGKVGYTSDPPDSVGGDWEVIP